MTACITATIDPEENVPKRITSFLLKIASRCNLDCDYCYMYHHIDQTWRSMPAVMDKKTRTAFASRLADYVSEQTIDRCLVIFHGGEPLLAGVGAIAETVDVIRSAVPKTTSVEFGLQTNGILLSDEVLGLLEEKQVSVSLSIDGPKEANDLHRTSRKGRSSFEKVMAGLELLQNRPATYAGVIAVIDPQIAPLKLFEFFDELRPPKLDFLLPDANHLREPPGREADTTLYSRWLLEAFDLWFGQYPHLPIRLFEALLDAVAGLPSGTDAFGFGDVSLISIETDGTYHDLDVLKVTSEGATKLDGSVFDTSILDVARNAKLATHGNLLALEGLSDNCKACSEVQICGGGSVPHRHGHNGYDNPTVYCNEMLQLIQHARHRVAEALTQGGDDVAPTDIAPPLDVAHFENAETGNGEMQILLDSAIRENCEEFDAALKIVARRDSCGAVEVQSLRALPLEKFQYLATRAGTVAWQRTVRRIDLGFMVHAVDGTALSLDLTYPAFLLKLAQSTSDAIAIGENDPWVRLPFGQSIVFDPDPFDEKAMDHARQITKRALAIVREWRPDLLQEMELACNALQFVRDPSAHPDKIVSFSDNAVPGALFVSVRQGLGWIDEYDLADSIVHEHRHQKLYLLERLALTVPSTADRVVSPWREELRPASGLFHAVFVFVELSRFWRHVANEGPQRLRNRALNQISETDERLKLGIKTLRECPLTPTGKALLEVLDQANVPA